MVGTGRADVIPAQRVFYIVECIADLGSELFAGQALDHVLILNLRKLRASTKRLPQPDRWNVDHCFVSHDVLDSAGRISLHDAFRNHGVE
jgi:hypothetical protein